MIKKIAGLCMMLTASMFLLGGIVMAETVYPSSDIECIYISSDTSISTLQKEYVSARIEVVKKDGNVEISDDAAQVKLRGNSTSKAKKKPFKIKFSSKQSVLGMDKGKKWNLLANSFDKTMLRNKLGLELATDSGLNYISQSAYADVFYNGVLLGNYLITEPVEAGSNQVDIEESETSEDFMVELERERNESDVTYTSTKSGIRFAVNVPEVPTSTQMSKIDSFLGKVDNAIKTKRMSEYSKYIDVDSFVNYYIVSEIFKAVDFNYSSTRFYVKNGKMYAGPLWDVDLSAGNASKRFYSGYYSLGESYKGLFCTEMKWYSYLIRSDEFVSKLNQRAKVLLPRIENMYKTNSFGKNQIDAIIDKYGASFQRNYKPLLEGGAGWSLTERYSICDNPIGLEFDTPANTFRGNVSLLRNWLSNRVNYLVKEWSGIKNNYVDELSIEKKSSTSMHLEWYNFGISDGNEVYMKTPKGKYRLVKTIKDGNKQECVIKNLLPGVRYTFKVRSYVTNGKTKYYTTYQKKSKTLKFKSPKVKVKAVKKNKKKLSWKKVAGAQGYVVYGGTSKKKMKKLKTLKKTSCSVKKKLDKKYYYKVKAFIKVDGKRIYSK